MQGDNELVDRLAKVMPDLIEIVIGTCDRIGWKMNGRFVMADCPANELTWIAAHAKAAMEKLGWGFWDHRMSDRVNGRLRRVAQCCFSGFKHQHKTTGERNFDPSDPLSESRAVILCCLDALGGE